MITNLKQLDPYSILGIPKGSSSSVIRAAYTRLIIQHHPDKQQQQQQQHLSGLSISNEFDSPQSSSSFSSSTSTSSFIEIQAAWEALRDDSMIITGSVGSNTSSSSLINQKQKQRRSVAILEEVSLENDLHSNSDKSSDYIYNCRCGGDCILQQSNIEKAKKNDEELTVQCPTCSLAYKVVQ